MPISSRRNMVRELSPSSLCHRCSHVLCRRIVHLFAHGVQRAVWVESWMDITPDAARLAQFTKAAACLGRIPDGLTADTAAVVMTTANARDFVTVPLLHQVRRHP